MTAPLDPVKTAPFCLGTPNLGPRVLLVHGFTGTPWDMRPLGGALAANGFYVKGLRLPGHGTTPEDMLAVQASDWQRAVDEALLSESEPVFLVGLSMGALLCVCAAARYPRQVRALVALAPAMDFIDPLLQLVARARAFGLVEAARPWIIKTSTDIDDPLARQEAPILPRYPSGRLRDLVFIRDEAVRLMDQVRCPTLLFGAENDHAVSLRGVRRLAQGLRRSPRVRLVRLAKGFHIIPRDREGPLVAREVSEFLSQQRQFAPSHLPSYAFMHANDPGAERRALPTRQAESRGRKADPARSG